MIKLTQTESGRAYSGYTSTELFKMFAADKKNIPIRNELASRNQALVVYILKKYYASRKVSPETREELIQEGMVGLLSAIEGFDHTLGFKFSTYSSWWIKQAINNYLINVNPIIRVPGHIRAEQNKLFKELRLQNKDVADILNMTDEEAGDYGLSKKMLKSIKCAIKSKHVAFMQTPPWLDHSGSAGETTLEDSISSEHNSLDPGEDSGREHVLDKKIMLSVAKETLRSMPEKRKLILLLRYGVIDEADLCGGEDKNKNEK
jgi:RNA polymerase primary sigma factor